MRSDITIEICCADIHSVILAQKYNVDAIELCVDLHHGGLTPSIALIKKARSIFKKEMAVFFRPRNGNFVYDEIEQEIILEDIQTAIDLGIDTIVAGGLTNTGNLDISFLKKLRAISQGKILSYHRAIDVAENPLNVLSQLIELNVDRLLSSGCASNAVNGIQTLKTWNQKFGDQIEIMAAGGIQAENIVDILNTTGLKRFHASLRQASNQIEGIMNLGCQEQADEALIQELILKVSIINSK
ncbi:MAG: copper homeostasis protein CutC [Saprospiraceae bacterium]|nr:copper homeostasis protein CutC [Saprospiraceae bacterium]